MALATNRSFLECYVRPSLPVRPLGANQNILKTIAARGDAITQLLVERVTAPVSEPSRRICRLHTPRRVALNQFQMTKYD